MRAVARVALAALLGCALIGLRHPLTTTLALFQSSTLSPSNSFLSLQVQPATLTTASASGALVHLVWNASPTAASETVTYGILRRPSGTGAFAQVATTSALTYDDAPGDGRYDYAIRSAVSTFTADGNAQSAMVDTTPPSAASAVTAGTGTTKGTVALSWTAATDATSGVSGYTIRYVQTGTCPAATTTNYPNTVAVGVVTSTTVTGLTSAKNYCFYLVTSDNAGDQSGPSNVANAKAK